MRQSRSVEKLLGLLQTQGSPAQTNYTLARDASSDLFTVAAVIAVPAVQKD